VILSDSHCHLDQYRNGQFNEILGLAKNSEIGLIVTMGLTVNNSENIIKMAQTYDIVYAAVGIHPFYSVSPTDNIKSRLHELARSKHVVAIGEVGLDYFHKPDTKQAQQDLLDYEFLLARKLNLPVSIHCREAYQDIMSILKDHVKLGLRGWIHSFMAGPVELQEWLDLGFFVAPGFTGIVHTENEALQEAMRLIPEDRLLIESDCANTKDAAGPHEVVMAAQKLAIIRSTSLEHIARVTTDNLKRLLALSV
jgi:TatD DNase family protein